MVGVKASSGSERDGSSKLLASPIEAGGLGELSGVPWLLLATIDYQHVEKTLLVCRKNENHFLLVKIFLFSVQVSCMLSSRWIGLQSCLKDHMLRFFCIWHCLAGRLAVACVRGLG